MAARRSLAHRMCGCRSLTPDHFGKLLFRQDRPWYNQTAARAL